MGTISDEFDSKRILRAEASMASITSSLGTTTSGPQDDSGRRISLTPARRKQIPRISWQPKRCNACIPKKPGEWVYTFVTERIAKTNASGFAHLSSPAYACHRFVDPRHNSHPCMLRLRATSPNMHAVGPRHSTPPLFTNTRPPRDGKSVHCLHERVLAQWMRNAPLAHCYL